MKFWKPDSRALWPQALFFVAGAMRAGLHPEQAINVLIEEAPEPLRSHFQKRLSKAPWLLPAKKVEILFSGPELGLARAAMLLALETGGELAPLLERAAHLLQKKNQMDDRFRALTAQARASAWIVGGTPLALLAAFSVFAPDFAAPLFHTRQGHTILAAAALLIGIGFVVVLRMSKLEP